MWREQQARKMTIGLQRSWGRHSDQGGDGEMFVAIVGGV